MTQQYKVIEILEHVTIINSDRSKTYYEVVHATKNGIHIGNISFKPKNNLLNLDIHCKKNTKHTCFNAYEEFVKKHYIPKNTITEITHKTKRHILTQI